MKDLKKQCFSIPNIISLFRIFMIIPFVILFLRNNYIYSALILLISGFSDMFDGMIARKFNQITQLGQILDPIADKLTLVAVVVCMSIKFSAIIPIAILFVIKDVSMLIAGLILIKKGIAPPAAKWYGKIATVVFYVSIILIILLKAIFGIYNLILLIVLLSITSIFMVFALIKYFILFLNLIRN